MEQEQEASWLEQILEIEEKSPIEQEQETSQLEQISEIEGNSPIRQQKEAISQIFRYLYSDNFGIIRTIKQQRTIRIAGWFGSILICGWSCEEITILTQTIGTRQHLTNSATDSKNGRAVSLVSVACGSERERVCVESLFPATPNPRPDASKPTRQAITSGVLHGKI